VEAGGVSNGTAGTNPSGNVLTNDTDVDAGDTQTVTGVAAGTVGSASGNVASNVTGTYGAITIAANGTYTYTVDNSNAAVQALRTSGNTLTDTFTYTMRDAAGLTSTTQVTITIQGANDAPHDLLGALSIAENSANGTAVGLTAAASDADATTNTITYTLDDTAGGRFAINSSTGVVTVANGSLLDFETATSHNITVRATSADGSWSTQTFTINLTNVDESPTAVADTAIAVEAGGVSNGTAGTNPSGNVLTNDTDPDAGDTKTVTGVAAGTVGSASGNVAANVTGTYGSINISANGTYTYTVDNSNAAVQALRTSGNTLTDTFTYTMRDAAGLTSTTQVTITDVDEFDIGAVSDTNAAANSLAENSANGTAVGITASATEADATA
ncbi:MAG: VCBS domain-containing protein, partial [Planctomycetota bacterium]